jgi:hypothetical protein
LIAAKSSSSVGAAKSSSFDELQPIVAGAALRGCPLYTVDRCMPRRRARCAFRRTVASASARNEMQCGRAMRRACGRPRLFSACLAKQIECENGGGFLWLRAFDGCPSGAEAPGGGLHHAGLEPVYARAIILPIAATRGSNGYRCISI